MTRKRVQNVIRRFLSKSPRGLLWTSYLRFLWLGGLVCLAGCGPSSGQVTGKVTLNGHPVTGAKLVFESKDNPEAIIYYGVTGLGGVIQVDDRSQGGIPVGQYKVTVTHYTLKDATPLPEGEQGEVLKQEGNAVEHTKTFDQDISAGSNTVRFELGESNNAQKD